MKRAPVRHSLEFAPYLAWKRFLLSRPHEAAREWGHRVGRLGYGVLRSRRALAFSNLELVMPELGRERHERIARDCFENWGAAFCETLSAERFSSAEIDARFHVEGWEHVERARAKGRGLFFTSGHYGAFELGMYPLALRLGSLHVISKPPDNARIYRDLLQTRERFGVAIIHKKESSRRMLQVLRDRGSIFIMIDQRARPKLAIQVPFLGRPALTSPGLALLSLRTGAPVVPCVCVPAPGGSYRAIFEPAIDPPEGDPAAGREEAVRALTRLYLETVERRIRERPEYWLWMHRRWRIPASTAAPAGT